MKQRDCMIVTDKGRYTITDLETDIKASGTTVSEAKLRLSLALKRRNIEVDIKERSLCG